MSMKKYEIRWGDSRGNSESIVLTGALQAELVIAMASGLQAWFRDRPNPPKDRRFVYVDVIEEVTDVIPIYRGEM